MESIEIKFRGKCLDNWEWVYGYLADENYINDINSIDLSSIEVDSETIGQFTGKKDKNGKGIYDGDVVEVNDKYGANRFRVIVKWHQQSMAFVAFKLSGKKRVPMSWFIDVLNNPEVIGNEFDNPELLK